MTWQPTASERRTITVGALIGVPIVIFFLGVRPYRAALSETRDRLVTERDALSHERGAILAAQRNPALKATTDSALQLIEPRLFHGDDDVIATAELANYVGDLAHQHHVWMQDASTRPATPLTSGVRTLHVDIRGETDYQGALEFLQALEQGDKSVRVERLDISRGISGTGNERAETLVFAATLSGFALGDGNAVPAVAPAPRPAPAGVP